MLQEPAEKYAVAFIDGSNMRHNARTAFGEAFANFNPLALAETVCAAQGWRLAGVQLYLGVPDVRVSEDAHYASIKRCARWRRQGVKVFTRTLLDDGAGGLREKGIDVRLALDAIELYRQGAYDVALLFSQDQDFAELASEIKALARQEGRWVQVASAFPDKGASKNGVHGTYPIAIDQDTFTRALDTPENRQRRLAAVVPMRAPDVSRRREEASRIERLRKPRGGRRRGRRTPLWVSLTAASYLIVAAFTFGYLVWQTRAALRVPETRAALLVNHTARAFIWPLYWLGTDDFARLKRHLVQFDPTRFHP
jgi:uncharacterized LabA/DUF88 family protein